MPASGGKRGYEHLEASSSPDEPPASPSAPPPSPSALEAALPPQLGVWKLAALTFFAVSGGPFGVEPLVRTGGPGFAALGLLTIPWVWGIPMAMMTAELSTAMPESGGYIVWIHRAFGDFWATQASVWTLCNAFLDNAMYPIMFVDYVTAFFTARDAAAAPTPEGSGSVGGVGLWQTEGEEEMGSGERWLVGMCMTLPIVLLNLRGVDFVADGALAFCVLAVTPFVVMVALGAPALSIDAVSAEVAEPRWGTFLTVLLWNTCGYDSAGTLAAEVEEPSKVYMPAMVICVVASTLVYLLPILVGVSAEGTEVSLWVDGYWSEVGGAIGGELLAGWVMLAGAISTAGLLNTLLCTTSRALACMGQRRLMPRAVGRLHSRYGTPHVAIGIMTAAIALLMLSDFETLIEANMLTYILKMLLEYAALIRLRFSEPEMPRPYRIRCGVPGLCLLFAPPLLLSCALASLAQPETLLATAGVLLLGVVVYALLRRYVWDSAASSLDVSSEVGAGTGSESEDEGTGLVAKGARRDRP